MQRKKYHTWLNPSPERNGRPSVQPRTSRWRNVTGTQQSEVSECLGRLGVICNTVPPALVNIVEPL